MVLDFVFCVLCPPGVRETWLELIRSFLESFVTSIDVLPRRSILLGSLVDELSLGVCRDKGLKNFWKVLVVILDLRSSMFKSRKIVFFVGFSMIHSRFPQSLRAFLNSSHVLSWFAAGRSQIPKISSIYLL